MFLLASGLNGLNRGNEVDFHTKEGGASEHTYLLCNHHEPMVVWHLSAGANFSGKFLWQAVSNLQTNSK